MSWNSPSILVSLLTVSLVELVTSFFSMFNLHLTKLLVWSEYFSDCKTDFTISSEALVYSMRLVSTGN